MKASEKSSLFTELYIWGEGDIIEVLNHLDKLSKNERRIVLAGVFGGYRATIDSHYPKAFRAEKLSKLKSELKSR